MTHVPTLMRGFSCFLLLAGVSACTYLIPDDVSVPRNNIVQGEKHKPLRNTGSQNITPQNGASLQPVPAMQMAAAAPVMPVAVNPVSAPIQSSMEYPQYASPAPAAPSRITTLDRVSTLITPTESGATSRQELSAPTPVPNVAATTLPRQVPVENAALGQGAPASVVSNRLLSGNSSSLAELRAAPAQNQTARPLAANGAFVVASNDQATGLMNVPPRPPLNGPDSTYSTMGTTRKDMEQSRSDSLNARKKMESDVTQEPSVFTKPAISPNAPEILSPLPTSVAPQAAPNMTPLPTPAMAPASPVPPSVAPAAVPVPASLRVTPAPTSSLVAPVPATPAAIAMLPAPLAAPAPVVAKAPMPPASGLPPISLKTPAPLEVASVKPTLPPLPKRTGRGFDPMAAVPPEQTVAQLPPIALTAPAPVAQAASSESLVDQSSTSTSILANSAFNPLNKAVGGARQTQYLSPSRYSENR